MIEYSKNYLKKSGSLWNYYRDEPNSGAVKKKNIAPLWVQNLLIKKKHYRKIGK